MNLPKELFEQNITDKNATCYDQLETFFISSKNGYILVILTLFYENVKENDVESGLRLA